MTDPMTTERLAEISERLTTPRLGRSMAHASDCWTNCTPPTEETPHPGEDMTLTLTPIAFDQACLLVRAWHRHHRPPAGHKYSIGLAQDGELVGAIIVGRPVARHYDDGITLEVTRSVVAPDIPNGNSMLYGAAWRAAKALGYRRLITYTQDGESGASLRGAGWRVVAERPPRKGWDTPARRRLPSDNDGIARTLWEAP